MQRIFKILFFLLMVNSVFAQSPLISEMEYFIDTDPGYEQANPLSFTPDSNFTLNYSVDISTLNEGLHFIYVRAKDENGRWGETYSRPFIVKEKQINFSTIIRIEYFIDSDPGFSNGQSLSITPDTVVEFSDFIDVSTLSRGLHFLYLRAQDEYNSWSETYSRPFIVVGKTDPKVNQIEYFIDEDPGFGQGTTVSFDTAHYYDSSFVIDISGYEDGLHTINYRAKDNSGNWGNTYSRHVLFVTLHPEPNINRIEYFFNEDPGYGLGDTIGINPDSTIDLFSAIDLSGLDNGLNFLYIRAQDENGSWSNVYSKPFIVSGTTHPKVVEIHYAFDADPLTGNGVKIDTSLLEADLKIDTNLFFPFDTLSTGFYQLYVRARDENNAWSFPIVRQFYVFGLPDTMPNLTQFEYFIDEDPGYGQGNKVIAGDSIYENNLALDLTGVSPGLHVIYLRAKDSEGQWSQVYSRPVLVSGTNKNPKIIEIEYAFDYDPGFEKGVKIPVGPDSLFEDTINISLDTIPGGPHQLYIRAKDDNNNYSLTFIGQFCKGAVPKFIADSVCFGEPTLFTDFTIDSEDTTTYVWDFNSDDTPEMDTTKGSISFIYPGPGEHEASLVVYDNPVCQDTFSMPVLVYGLPQPDIGNDTVICENENLVLGTSQGFNSYLWVNGTTGDSLSIDTTGIYWLEVSDSNNCYNRDSVNVVVNPVPFVYLGNDTGICEYQTMYLNVGTGYYSYLWSNGETDNQIKVDSTRTYWLRVENSFHCYYTDSVNVDVFPRPYIDLGNDTAVCDNMNLVLNAPSGYKSYLWNTGSRGSAIPVVNSGNYWAQVIDSSNCFNRDTIGVDIIPSPSISLGEDVDLCEGEVALLEVPSGYNSYLWSDGSPTPAVFADATGKYWVRVANIENCVTTDTVNVNVHPLPAVNLGNDTVINKGEMLTLDENVDNASYSWRHAFETTKSIKVNEKGAYRVIVVDQYNCRNSDTIFVTVMDNQQIILRQGWNIFSMYVRPESNNVQGIVQALIDEGSLIKVQDEKGGFIEYIEGEWINNIPGHMATEGYYIKVDTNTSLDISGEAIVWHEGIPLHGGWNLVSFPVDSAMDINQALGSFLGLFNFQKLQDETGASYEYINPVGYIENIDSLKPGEGYKLRVKESTHLFYGAHLKEHSMVQEQDKSHEYFKPSWQGNGYNHMNVFVKSLNLGGFPLEPGDEIGVFDGNVCVGLYKMNDYPLHGFSIPVTQDDPMTSKKDGFTPGNTLEFSVWKHNTGDMVTDFYVTYHPGYDRKFTAKGTAVVSLRSDMEGTDIISVNRPFKVGDNYPNPFDDFTIIPIELDKPARLKLELFDVTGNGVGTVLDQLFSEGNHEVIIRKEDHNLKNGLYLCVITINKHRILKKIAVR